MRETEIKRKNRQTVGQTKNKGIKMSIKKERTRQTDDREKDRLTKRLDRQGKMDEQTERQA
jgi:hypothetical protein